MLKFMVDVVQLTKYRTFVAAETKDEAMAIALERAKHAKFRKLAACINSVRTVAKPPKKFKKRYRPIKSGYTYRHGLRVKK